MHSTGIFGLQASPEIPREVSSAASLIAIPGRLPPRYAWILPSLGGTLASLKCALLGEFPLALEAPDLIGKKSTYPLVYSPLDFQWIARGMKSFFRFLWIFCGSLPSCLRCQRATLTINHQDQ